MSRKGDLAGSSGFSAAGLALVATHGEVTGQQAWHGIVVRCLRGKARQRPGGNLGRLVIVSNRVPLPSERGPRAGGLAVALADALTPGSVWFGWSGRRSGAAHGEVRMQRAEGMTYATIDLTEAEYRSFYVNFANGALWPLLHFRLGLVQVPPRGLRGVSRASTVVCRGAGPAAAPDDVIWVHDYHLIPLAEELRALGVTQSHRLLPAYAHLFRPTLLHALPRAAELLRAMCAYDVVGFHTAIYREAFLDCVQRNPLARGVRTKAFMLGGRHVRAIVDPIGIDADGFADDRRARRPQCRDGAACAIAWAAVRWPSASIGWTTRRVWSTVSRPSAVCSAKYPEHRRQVSFLQIAARSREESGSYQRLRRELDRIVGDTNGTFLRIRLDAVALHDARRCAGNTLAGFSASPASAW